MGGYQGAPGIALGSILGAALAAVTLALEVTALFEPLELGERHASVLAMPVAAMALFGGSAWTAASRGLVVLRPGGRCTP